MRNDRLIYDEKTSRLYSPDGRFLKKVYCPKALNWNQLTIVDGEDRWRGCDVCNEKVLNLDVADVSAVIKACRGRWEHVCIHASATSEKVIFLRDEDAPPRSADSSRDKAGLLVIKTARNIADINRAVGLGYWPDVRFIEYNEKILRSKISIGQHRASGRIETTGDFRSSFPRTDRPEPKYKGDASEEGLTWLEAIPFQWFYQYYQEVPVAAYLIPVDLPDGTEVLVEDPIEDIVGMEWNQGNSMRANNVRGHIESRRVIIHKAMVRASHVVG